MNPIYMDLYIDKKSGKKWKTLEIKRGKGIKCGKKVENFGKELRDIYAYQYRSPKRKDRSAK